MKDPLQIRPSRVLAPLLATAAILLMGTAFVVAIILGFGEAKPIPIAIAVGCGFTVGLLLWLLRDKPEAKQRHWFAWVSSRRGVPEPPAYRLAIIRQKLEFGKKQPPTLEELREMKDPTRTWVPHRSRNMQSPPEEHN